MFALGLLLVLLGALLAAAEAHVPSHGVLGSGAVVALADGRRAAALRGRQRRARGGLRRPGIGAARGRRVRCG